MICLYVMSLADFPTQSVLPLLSPLRQQRIATCRRPQDAAALAGAGWLLRQALQQWGVEPHRQILTQNPWGKPQLAETALPQFSLSHGGGWAVCAVSDTPVGVDVEAPRCTMAVAKRWFHENEIRAAEALPQAQQADALLRIWTAKEAFLKALGRGLTLPLDSFVVRLDDDGALLLQSYSDEPWQLHEYTLDGARICLCTTESCPEPETVTIANCAP